MSEHIHIEVDTEEMRGIVIDAVRKYIGEGINAVGIYQSKEELAEVLLEEEE